MKIKYLNRSQAIAICADYQHLIGKPFNAGNMDNSMIRQVIVAPHSRILKWQFIRSILKGIPPEDALQIVRNGRYDVIVLPDYDLQPLQDGFQVKGLRDYLAEQGISFDQNVYRYLPNLSVAFNNNQAISPFH